MVHFPPFRLDLRRGQLYRRDAAVPLRPKTFAVLRYLVAHAGELVSKTDLLDAVWDRVAVTEDMPRICVSEIRRALGDDARSLYVETVPARGYRFVAALAVDAGDGRAEATSWPSARPASFGRSRPVGRDADLAELARSFDAAAAGGRSVCFVSGEAGVGKTTLVREILERVSSRSPGQCPTVATGQCIEHLGGDAFCDPVLEAVRGLWRGEAGAGAARTLREHVPAWLAAAWGLVDATVDSTPPSGAAVGARAVGLLAETIEALAQSAPLVLVVEDLHWSDAATVTLLNVLARRGRPARLLVMGTLRTGHALAAMHPVLTVKQDLLEKSLCQEIVLRGLSHAEISRYLGARLGQAEIDGALPTLLLDRTEGHPFLLEALVGHLLERGLLVRRGDTWQLDRGTSCETAIPPGVRAGIEHWLATRLSREELRWLEAASLTGRVFGAEAAAARIGAEVGREVVERAEEIFEGLVGRQEILHYTSASESDARRPAGRYAFDHEMCREVLSSGIPPYRRCRLQAAVEHRSLPAVVHERLLSWSTTVVA